MSTQTIPPDALERPAAMAGMFYPADAGLLSRTILEYLEGTPHKLPTPGVPKALIVPHAGYIYSGAVAASAYDLLRPARGIVKRVVLLGPCHRVAVRGLALPQATVFQTPLGRVQVDRAAAAAIMDLPQVVESDAAHAQEHAIEVQLPFLQLILGEFSLVPLAVGNATSQQVAEVIERLWGGPETLIVISSDLSHFHPYAQARDMDAGTTRSILQFEPGISHQQACGATPIAGLLIAAQRHKLQPRLLDCRNSGDTAGGRDRVVGYASFSFGGAESAYADTHGSEAIRIARRAIAAGLGMAGEVASDHDGWLREYRASFVTLKLDGGLRGCIGSLEPRWSLAADIAHNASASAFQDPRFGPLSRDEFARISIEVSVLSRPKRIAFANHAELVATLRPGQDGVIIECAGRRSTFLPQVWEQLPKPEEFLAQLKLKAGLPASTPSERCVVKRYTVVKWREGGG